MNDDVMTSRERIGLLLAKRRTEARLSVRQLAEMSDVSFQNVTKIENGKYNVSIDILSRICDALGCEIDIIMKDKAAD